MGFEPTPTFVDQNTHSPCYGYTILESGALDRSAILTGDKYRDTYVSNSVHNYQL